jgi:hypothetical protein
MKAVVPTATAHIHGIHGRPLNGEPGWREARAHVFRGDRERDERGNAQADHDSPPRHLDPLALPRGVLR